MKMKVRKYNDEQRRAKLHAVQRRHGGNWQKEQLDNEGAAGAGAAQHTSFPDSQDLPKMPTPDKSKLFTGAPSHSFAVEAHSAL